MTGRWVWPGVAIGHTVAVGNLRRDNETTVIRTLSLVPKPVDFLQNAVDCNESAALHSKFLILIVAQRSAIP